ncbi:MAG: hypothetical protein U0842_22935 [Candidatus Binatia bacterium]
MSFQFGRKKPAEKPETVTNLLGSEIDARCKKCRATTKHVVIGKVGPKPTRVRCGTCEFEHEYTAPRARRAATATQAQLPWAEALAQSRATAAPYSADTSYRVGSRVTHASFGEGVVVALASPTVCEVLFESRTVKLVMKGQPSTFEAPEPRTTQAPRRGRRES